MAIPEDVDEQWNEFANQLMRIDSPGDFFGSDLDQMLATDLGDAPSFIESLDGEGGESVEGGEGGEGGEGVEGVAADDAEDIAEDMPEDVLVLEDILVTNSPKKSREPAAETMLGVVGADAGGILKTSKLFAHEDFVSFIAREGGVDRDSLAKLVGGVSPMPDEDFVAFMARANGINDEKMIERLRKALELEPVTEFRSRIRPVKIKEEDEELQVREGEDAATFFARTGSWDSASTVSEDMASAGEDFAEGEYAGTIFGRNEGTAGGSLPDEGGPVHGSQIGSRSEPLDKQGSLLSRGSKESNPSERVILKKRKATA